MARGSENRCDGAGNVEIEVQAGPSPVAQRNRGHPLALIQTQRNSPPSAVRKDIQLRAFAFAPRLHGTDILPVQSSLLRVDGRREIEHDALSGHRRARVAGPRRLRNERDRALRLSFDEPDHADAGDLDARFHLDALDLGHQNEIARPRKLADADGADLGMDADRKPRQCNHGQGFEM